jgi:hypothetical protein
VTLCGLVTAASAQGQAVGAASPSRLAEDRRVDESSRQTQAARQTEAPKPAAAPKRDDAPAKAQPRAEFQRQAEPQRQLEPRRQPEPQRQFAEQRRAAPSHQGGSDHWQDPGPAWRSLPPAWRDLNDRPSEQRPGIKRPGEDAFRGQRDGRSRGRKDHAVYIPYTYPLVFDYLPYYPSDFEGGPGPAPAPAPAPSDDERPLGFLQLRVQPRTAEVFVDGAFAGTVDDFGGRSARMLVAGPHRVEIVAGGYQTITIDVRVPENDTVTFTRDLEPAVGRPAPESIVVPHKAMYIVPQCYIGDRLPLPGDMPQGCRVEDVRVIP